MFIFTHFEYEMNEDDHLAQLLLISYLKCLQIIIDLILVIIEIKKKKNLIFL